MAVGGEDGLNVIETEASNTNTSAAETNTISGGISSSGCARIASAPFLIVVRSQSAATATAMPAGVKLGPYPILAPLRTRISAAFRCSGVSPGSR